MDDKIIIARGSSWTPYVQYQQQMDKLMEILDKGTLIAPQEYELDTSIIYNDEIYKMLNEKHSKSFSFETLNENTITKFDRITQLKSQLKHCKNPLQKLNIERELNRLYKNKER